MTFNQLLKKHGVVGPVFCGLVIVASVYAGVKAVSQIKTEWGYLRKNSRQGWKERIKPTDS